MKTVLNLLLVCCFALVSTAVGAESETDLIGILQSGASVPDKCAACQKLRVVGTEKAIPALASLLGQERTSHAARYALEAMPYPQAGEALRTALKTASGLIEAGIVDSLGWRGEPASVPILIPLLSDADPVIASACAKALGRIGRPDAITALIAMRDTVPPAVQPSVLEALLRAADKLGDNARAIEIYRGLFDSKFPGEIRAAAWRGCALADASSRAGLMQKALAGADRALRAAALKLVRETGDAKLLEACMSQWASLPPESQLALLDAHLKRGAEARPVVRIASQSPHASVRIAAWQALAGMGDRESIPDLAKAACATDPVERDTARESLVLLHGQGLSEAMVAQIKKADPASKVELLRAIGARGDKGATEVLLQNAADGPEPVRLAALASLAKLADPQALAPLLQLASKSPSNAARDLLSKALYAACHASPDKERASTLVIDACNRSAPDALRLILPLLAALGTSAGLDAVQAATTDKDDGVAKEAVRVLGQWPNAAPASRLLELARSGGDQAVRILALRGCITVLDQEPDHAKRLAQLQQAMAAAQRSEEKRQVLAQIGQIPSVDALKAIAPSLSEPDLADEAGLAAMSVAEKIAPANPQLAGETAAKILAQSKNAATIKRAWAVRGMSVKPGPFIRDWLVSGPYRQADAIGAAAQFDLAYAPEKPGEAVQWRTAPQADLVDLMGLFPGQENCAAYLKAQIVAPEAAPAMLLLASDDGVKAWLNGAVVHANNIDRGLVADQDLAGIMLKKGTNDLMLKVTQGGGGWAACARIVAPNGQPLPDLRIVPVK
jgi:HEAT repeat protein